EGGGAFDSTLFHIARTLARSADERQKPNGERLREFVGSARESLEFQLFSEEPIYDDLEQLKLADSLTALVEHMGYVDPLVQKVLAGKSPRQRAGELIQGTRVKSVAFRNELYQGGPKAIQSTRDAMIDLARLVDGDARELRKIIEAQSETKQQAHAQIGK